MGLFSLRTAFALIAVLFAYVAYQFVFSFYDTFVTYPWFMVFPPFSSNGKFPSKFEYQILTAINLNKDGVERYDSIFHGVQVSVLRPIGSDNSKLRPAVVHFHGGGFAFLTRQYVEPTLYELIRKTGIIVVNVEYRQPPDHPFPAAFDDCRLAAEYVLGHGQQLGIDTKRVAVMGDSAGGNLAAAVGQSLRKRLKLQVIVYPAVQAISFNMPCHLGVPLSNYCPPALLVPATMCYANISFEHITRFQVDRHLSESTREKLESLIDISSISDKIPSDQLTAFERQRVVLQSSKKAFPDVPEQKRWEKILLDPRFSPLAQRDWSELAPAYLITSSCDVIRDDGLLYKKRLEMAKIPVTHHHYNGFHGIFHHAAYRGLLRLDVGQKLISDLSTYLAQHL